MRHDSEDLFLPADAEFVTGIPRPGGGGRGGPLSAVEYGQPALDFMLDAGFTVRWKGSETSLQVNYVTRKLTSW